MPEPAYRIAQRLLARRAEVGLYSYGEHLKPFNKRCSLIDAIEESADMLCYLLNMAQESRVLMIDLIANSVRLREAGHAAAADGLDEIIVGMGGKETLARYDEILGTVALSATVGPDSRDEARRRREAIAALCALREIHGGIVPDGDVVDDINYVIDLLGGEAAPVLDPRYEALRVAEAALLHIQRRAEPLGIDRGDTVTHLMATNALEAIRGAR